MSTKLGDGFGVYRKGGKSARFVNNYTIFAFEGSDAL